MLTLAGAGMYFGIISYYPGIAALKTQQKTGIVILLVAVPYYFSSLIAFFFSPQTLACQEEKKGIEIVGRIFYIDTTFGNPGNHLVFSTVLIFLSLAILFFPG